MAVAALVLVVTATAIPSLLGTIDRSRGYAAARFLAGRLTLARTQAVSRGVTVALAFNRDQRGTTYRVYRDGNRNGVLTRDIRRGIDTPIEELVRLANLFPGVEFGTTPAAPLDDPIRLGGSDILSFTPSGTATSGTLYLRGRDGTQWAVRILGATARTRVLRYRSEGNEWVEP